MKDFHPAQLKIYESNARFKIVCAGRRFGKALDIDTDIPLFEGGFKKLKELVLGDILIDEQGNPTRVTEIGEVYTDRPTYKITFSDYSEVIADENHEWFAWEKSARKAIKRSKKPICKPRIYETKDFVNNLKVGNKNESNFSIQTCKPVNYDKKFLPIHPYFLGIWLGDGTSANSEVTVAEPETIEFLKELGFEINTGKAKYHYWAVGLNPILRKLNLLKNKHIPFEYLYSSYEDRLWLLKGLMDSDGNVGSKNNCEFNNTNYNLILDVKQLIESLGIKTTVITKDAKIKNKFISKTYTISFTTDISVFNLERKRNQQKFSTFIKNKHRYIVSIERVYGHQTKCIEVDSPNHLFLVTKSFIPTHNSLLSVISMMYFALLKPRSKVMYFAPTIKQARDIVWDELKVSAREAGIMAGEPNESRLEIQIKNIDSTGKLLPSVSIIHLKGVDNIESARGNKIDYLIMDEVASMRNWNYMWNKVLRPTLTDTKGQALMISSPVGFNHFYEMFNRSQNDSDYASFRFTSYDNPYLPKEELEKARLELSDDAFKQEYLAEFVSVSGQVYKEFDVVRQFVPVEYDPFLDLHVTMDFGVNDPTAIIWIQPNGGEFRIIDYHEESNANVDYFAALIKSKPYRDPSLFTGDPAGNARSIVTNTSPIEMYARHGIHIRTKTGVKIPEQVAITHKYVKGLYIDNNLERLRDCILNYRYPSKENTNYSVANEIPLHTEHSHAMRALEYYFVNIDSGSYFDRHKPIYLPQNDTSKWTFE